MLCNGTIGPRKILLVSTAVLHIVLFAEADQETLLDLHKTTQSTQSTKDNTRKVPHCKTCEKPMRGRGKATCTAP